jgi:hypothetical protein
MLREILLLLIVVEAHVLAPRLRGEDAVRVFDVIDLSFPQAASVRDKPHSDLSKLVLLSAPQIEAYCRN